MSSFLHIAPLLVVAEGLRARGSLASALTTGVDTSYSFDEFVQEFGRSYDGGSEEYARRSSVFQESLAQIIAKNSRTDRSWTAGVYPFMDLTAAERLQSLHGYDSSGSRRAIEPSTAHVAGAKLSLVSTVATAAERLYGGADESFDADAPEVRNQGLLCGSCWAFAAVEAVEAQLMQTDAYQKMGDPRVSVQALIECVTKEQTLCPETGGCKGATPDLAFQLMQDVGVPLESDLPYVSHPVDAKCPIKPYPKDWMRVTLAGWKRLPSNKAQPLMQALVNEGPVVVAADSHDWYPYKSGIFDGCSRDAIPNHSVLAKGYGSMDGQKYWRIQNTWGAKWGEEGSIRLLRHDDEDSWCGQDSQPQEATAQCGAGSGQNVTVCGTCGLLFDPIIPQGVDISSSTSARREFGPPPSSATLATDAIDSMIHATQGEASDQDSSSAEAGQPRRPRDGKLASQDVPAAEAGDASTSTLDSASLGTLLGGTADTFPAKTEKRQAPVESDLSKLAADFDDRDAQELRLEPEDEVSKPHGSAGLGTYLSSDSDPLLSAASSWQTARVPRVEVSDGSFPMSSSSNVRAPDATSELDSAMDSYVGTKATTTFQPMSLRAQPTGEFESESESKSAAAHRIADLFR